jgi:trehalose 6-phosphate synthase/phosphatase
VWFNSVYEVMRTYTENVDGAVVEERESTLVWNYKNAEEEHGSMVVGELYALIKQILGNSPVEIIQGKGYIEVKPIKLKKHKLLKLLFQKISATTKIDYLLYVGADTGNETVYQFLKQKRADAYFTREHPKRFICTLGKKPSGAQYYIDDVEEVKFMMSRLKATIQKRKRNRSYADLRDLQSTASPFEHDMLANAAHVRQDYSSNNVSDSVN